MGVEIGDVSSTVRAVDGDALLSPRVLAQIVAAVARALHDGGEDEKRAAAERRITGGVSAERDEAQ
jgi:hypothetical protein